MKIKKNPEKVNKNHQNLRNLIQLIKISNSINKIINELIETSQNINENPQKPSTFTKYHPNPLKFSQKIRKIDNNHRNLEKIS